MGVAAEVIEDLRRTSERAFGIDDPFDVAVSAQEVAEGLGVGQGFKVAKELQFSLVEGLFEVEEELSTKHAGKDFDRKKEVRTAGKPTCVIQRQSTPWNDAVHVRVVHQRLSPGVQHREEADLGSDVFWIGSDLT